MKGFDCFFFLLFCFRFCPSATRLLPSHLSLFSIFRLLRPFLSIKEESVRWIHTGRYWKEENLISLSSFLPIVAFLDKFIVSSEPKGAARVTISVNRKPTRFLFFCAYHGSPSLKTAQTREPLAEFSTPFYPTVQNSEVFPWNLSPTWHDRIHFFKNRFAFEIITINSTIGPPPGNFTTEQSDQCILMPTLNWVNC